MTDRGRTRTLALLGLAVVLIVTTLILWRPLLILWRPFGPLSLSGTVPAPTPRPARVLHFPENRSMGKLYIRDRYPAIGIGNSWRFFEEAEGTVAVPFYKELRLRLYADVGLVPARSVLAEIGQYDILRSLDLSGRIRVAGGASNRRVSNSSITDDDLYFIRDFRSLGELILTGANISEVGIEHLSALTSLEALHLNSTTIGDAALKQIGNLSSIVDLSISGTFVTDKGLAELGRLPLLRILWLSNNPQITDAGLMQLRSLPRIEQLNFSGTSITDAGLMHLQSLSRLQHLNLRATSITDKGLASLHSIRSLKSIVLIGTQVSPEGVASLKVALPNIHVEFLAPTPYPRPTPILPPQIPVS